MNYKRAFKPIKSVYRHLPDGKQKVPFDESEFAEDFFKIKNCCTSILEYYQNGNGLILPLIEQLNSFFSDNFNGLLNIDISKIQNLYTETEFDKFIFEIFKSDMISLEIVDAFITQFCIILDFSEFQSVFKSYENFQCFYDFFTNYNSENEELVYSLLKYYTCQCQYESTYIALFNDFSSLSNSIFDIMQDPLYNYQLSDIIVTAVSSKESASDIDQDIISGVISNYSNIIQNLPPFNDDDDECLFIFYHICKKMVKTDCFNTIKILKKEKRLETLLSTPINDSIQFKKSRIDFLRICLSNLQKKTEKEYILNESKKRNFDYSMIIQCSQSNSSILIKASLKFLSSFIPDLIDELFRNYSPETIIDFIKDILATGNFKEKYQSIEFITSLIKNQNYIFIRQLLLVDDDDENIFESFNNLMQADDDELKIKILSMIYALFDYLGISSHQKCRDIFTELIQNSGLIDDFEKNKDSENEIVRTYSRENLEQFNYYSNIKQNPNF